MSTNNLYKWDEEVINFDPLLTGEQKLWIAVIERRLIDYRCLLTGAMSSVLHRGTAEAMSLRYIEQFVLFELPAICDECNLDFDLIKGMFERVKGGGKVSRYKRRSTC